MTHPDLNTPLSGEEPVRTCFPNLARRDPSADEIEAVTATCSDELKAAGIELHVFGSILGNREVPSKAVGFVSRWGFKRAWYYWVAEGPGLPLEASERLHQTHGRDVRVEGHCGSPAPREYLEGFSVGSYHIDTAEGLKALADAIKSVGRTPSPTPEDRSSEGAGEAVSPLAEIISDAEIARVHGNANFGSMSPRQVVNDGVWKYSIGYSGGHTQLCILLEHGLICKPRPGRYDANLTKKGKRYVRALYQIEKASHEALTAQVAEMRAREQAEAQDQGEPVANFISVEAQAEAWSDRVEIQRMVDTTSDVFAKWASPELLSRFRQQMMGVIQQAYIEGVVSVLPDEPTTKPAEPGEVECPAPDARAGEPSGLSVEGAWQDLVEKDDRTSGEEYPDMCLITFEELADYMASAHPQPAQPSPGVHDEAVERLTALLDAVDTAERSGDIQAMATADQDLFENGKPLMRAAIAALSRQTSEQPEEVERLRGEVERLRGEFHRRGVKIIEMTEYAGAHLCRAERAEEERDALLDAAGFKPGPFRNDLSRKVILDDVAGMRPEMVRARRSEARVRSDADLWSMSAEMGDHPPLLVTVWKRAKAAERRAEAAEQALASVEAERAKDREALELANQSMACVTAFEDDARYIMGHSNFNIVQANRDAIKARLSSSKDQTPND